jgi:hypothetical protein
VEKVAAAVKLVAVAVVNQVVAVVEKVEEYPHLTYPAQRDAHLVEVEETLLHQNRRISTTALSYNI